MEEEEEDDRAIKIILHIAIKKKFLYLILFSELILFF